MAPGGEKVLNLRANATDSTALVVLGFNFFGECSGRYGGLDPDWMTEAGRSPQSLLYESILAQVTSRYY